MRRIYRFDEKFKKTRNKIAVTLTSLGLTFGGFISFYSLSLPSLAVAQAPNWSLSAPVGIEFTCGGGTYSHTLDTVSQDVDGNMTGNGHYNANGSYTWDFTGAINGDSITFTLVYTGSNSGYTLNAVGSVMPDGSVNGTTDGNCQTFTMAAGSATAIVRVGMCPDGTMQSTDPIDTFSVYSASVSSTPSSVSLDSGKKYLIVASGTWTNVGKNVSDAEYASTDGWSTHMDGYDINPYFLGEGEFDLRINDGFVDWGSYSSEHTYSYVFDGADSTVSLGVFDGNSNTNSVESGWYGDNSGSLEIKIYSCDKVEVEFDKDHCKKYGWRELEDDHGKPFRNQGQCVSAKHRHHHGDKDDHDNRHHEEHHENNSRRR
ncbi:hypothetical protein KC960_04470 [Candidatus Saccharibacteria bacterium]|nr:hypothetical protein [Candidatus Saccharibacteria bacterium]